MPTLRKNGTKGKRSARGLGRLFKKAGAKQYPADSNVKGNYYLTYTVKGERFTESLRDTDGNPITDRHAAESERARIMAPFTTGDKVETLQAVKARLDSAEVTRAVAEAEANPPPELAKIWRLFMQSPARPDSGDSTLKQYESEWKRFTAWLAEHHPATVYLHEVTAATAADYARDLTAAKVSASTFNQHRNLLRMVWRVLADECRLTGNPWDRIQKHKLNSLATRKRALTPAQFETLLAAVEGDRDLQDLFTLLAWTGLRRADAVLMKWGAVDFARRVITLAPVKTARRQGKQVHIPIFPAVLDVLNRRQAGKVLNARGLVFPELAAQYERDPSKISKDISAAFEKAGMETTEARADRGRAVVVYGAHSLRHFFVTQATSAGMPDAMIKSITGHGSDGMLEHYQQIGIDLAADMAGRIQGTGTALLADSVQTPAPVAANDASAILERIRALVEGMDGRNWRTVKAEILEGVAI